MRSDPIVEVPIPKSLIGARYSGLVDLARAELKRAREVSGDDPRIAVDILDMPNHVTVRAPLAVARALLAAGEEIIEDVRSTAEGAMELIRRAVTRAEVESGSGGPESEGDDS